MFGNASSSSSWIIVFGLLPPILWMFIRQMTGNTHLNQNVPLKRRLLQAMLRLVVETILVSLTWGIALAMTSNMSSQQLARDVLLLGCFWVLGSIYGMSIASRARALENDSNSLSHRMKGWLSSHKVPPDEEL